MISSLLNPNSKGVNYVWKGDPFKDLADQDSSFYAAQEQHQIQQQQQQAQTLLGSPRKLNKRSDNKIEINLPKTKLTRKGQIYLYTNGPDDLLKNEFGKGLMQKSYSKKWIDDISEDFGLDPLELLNDNFDEMGTPDPAYKNKIGKNTRYFIDDLKTKSGKDRYLNKSKYQEFLPYDFNSKVQLDEALNSARSRNQSQKSKLFDLASNSERTATSQFSFMQECDTSDEDENASDKTDSLVRYQSSKHASRLSSQPVLSAQNLINRLNSKLNSGFLIPGTNKRIDATDTNINSETDSNGTPHLMENLNFSYKDTFNFSEVNENEQRYKEEENRKLADEEIKKIESKHIEAVVAAAAIEKNKPESETKILNKRSGRKNSSALKFNAENLETMTINQTKTTTNTTKINLSPPLAKTERMQTKISSSAHTNKKHAASPRLSHGTIESDNLDKSNLAVMGTKPVETEEVSTSFSSRHQSFLLNRSQPTPFYTLEKNLTNSSFFQHHQYPQNVYVPTSQQTGFEEQGYAPITISVTQIDHELTGNSIKVRRFFDRQTLRIQQMSIKQKEHEAEPKTTHRDRANNLIKSQQYEPMNNLSRTKFSTPSSTPDLLKARLNSLDASNAKVNEESSEIKPQSSEDTELMALRASQILMDVENENKAREEAETSDEIQNEPIAQEETNKIEENFEPEAKTEQEQEPEYVEDIIEEIAEEIIEEEPVVEEENKTQEELQVIEEVKEEAIVEPVNESLSQTKIDEKIKNEVADLLLKSQNSNAENLRIKSAPNNETPPSFEVKQTSVKKPIKQNPRNIKSAHSRISSAAALLNKQKIGPKTDDANEKAPTPQELQNDYVIGLVESNDNLETGAEHIKLKSQPSIDETYNEKPERTSQTSIRSNKEHDKGKTRSPATSKSRRSSFMSDRRNSKSPKPEDFQDLSLTGSKQFRRTSLSSAIHKEYQNPLKKKSSSSASSFKSAKSNDEQQTSQSKFFDKEEKIELVGGVEADNVSVLSHDYYEVGDDLNQALFDEENNLSTFKIVVKNKSDSELNDGDNNNPNTNSTNNFKSQSQEIKVTKFLTPSEIEQYEKRSQSSLNNEKQNNTGLAESSSNLNELKSQQEQENLISNETKSAESIKDSAENREAKERLNEVPLASKQENEIEANKELKIEEIKPVEDYSTNNNNNNSEQAGLVENNELQITKLDTMPKAGKKVEFSNKVTEQIISDSPREEAENKVVKEVDFDFVITFNERKEEQPKAAPAIAQPKVDEAKTGAKSTKKPKEDAKPTGRNKPTKSTSKSPPAKPKSGKGPKATPEAASVEEPAPAQEPTLNTDILGPQNSKINELLGIKEEKPPEKPKPVIIKREKPMAKYPYLEIPWDSEKAVVDDIAYRDTFLVPDVLCPHLHKLDPTTTSIEELLLERRILEEKILELRTTTQNCINRIPSETDKGKKSDRKKKSAKTPKEDAKKLKEKEMKEKVLKEERMRLHNEALKAQYEKESIRNILVKNINEKDAELDNLNKELESNTKEYTSQYTSVSDQIKYLESSEDQVREALAHSRNEFREQMTKKQQEKRKHLKELIDERKEAKMFEFEVKQKELEWLNSMYNNPEEIAKVKAQQAELEMKIEQWMISFDNQCADEEKELDDKEVEDENRFTIMEQEEEEHALSSLKQEQFLLLQEKKTLTDNFEDMKAKILHRIQQINDEKKVIEAEIQVFDQNIMNNIEQQKKNLLEILQAEHEAKQQIKHDLDKYRVSLMQTREKNLEMKSNLAFFKHCHAINKPFVFSYVNHWTIESFSKPFGQDKKKVVKKK